MICVGTRYIVSANGRHIWRPYDYVFSFQMVHSIFAGFVSDAVLSLHDAKNKDNTKNQCSHLKRKYLFHTIILSFSFWFLSNLCTYYRYILIIIILYHVPLKNTRDFYVPNTISFLSVAAIEKFHKNLIKLLTAQGFSAKICNNHVFNPFYCSIYQCVTKL